MKFLPKHSKYSTYAITTNTHTHTHTHTHAYTHKRRKIDIHQVDSIGGKFGDQTRFIRFIIYFDMCCGYLNKFPLKWVSGTNLDSHFRFLKSHSLACEMVRSCHVGRL